MPTRRSRRPAVVALVVAVCASIAAADAEQDTTRCAFGGPVAGYRAMVLELPQGTDFLQLELTGQRSFPRALNSEDGWHLAEGIAVIDADTHEIMAHQVLYIGTAAPVVTAEVDGQQVARQPIQAGEGPWIHGSRNARPDLPPGNYYVVAFGTGGPTGGAFAQDWGGSIYLQGTHACHATAPGETFDFDHTQFSGGTQVYAAGVGIAEDVALTFDTDRPLVFGLMEAGVQGGGTGRVSLDYDMPSGAASLGRGIVPFVSSAGTHEFRASYQGVHPIVAVTGVALDLPR